ncbi:MAG: hypothetical protein H6860_00330 [Rhodospirillales bacterium]|nr:hypothetical protein [Alphaproteobacteria bacterium]MCB9980838.1 hypothetical protein [Rhodospirillales bacterium]
MTENRVEALSERKRSWNRALVNNVARGRRFSAGAILSAIVAGGTAYSAVDDFQEVAVSSNDRQARNALVSGVVKGIGGVSFLGLSGFFGFRAKRHYGRARKYKTLLSGAADFTPRQD